MLKLTTPKSFLRFAKNMTVGELKNVTDADLLEYTSEFQSTIQPDNLDDFSSTKETNDKMYALAVQVYGAYSKQAKYLARNFRKGDSLVSIHYSQFPTVSEITRWVENSKSGFYEDGCVPYLNYEKKEDN
jgi:hypothetical protein